MNTILQLHVAVISPPAVGAAPEAPSSLLTYIRDGGVISYVLIGLSIWATTLVIRNVFAFRRRVFAPPSVVGELERLLQAGRFAEARQFCRAPRNQCFVTNAMSEAFNRCAPPELRTVEFRSALEEAARAEADEVHRMNDGIGIIAAVGPMLGLLGTVIGMIGAFRTIGTLQGASRSTELASFMSMALVNTAEGLTVAIPCTVAFALFRRRIDRVLQLVGRDLERLGAYVSNGGAAASFDSRERAEGRPAPLAGAARA